MSLILALVLLLVILVVVDFYRKSLRVKQKANLENIEQESKEIFKGQLKKDSASLENQEEYVLLREGYLLLYFESLASMRIKDLAALLKGYGVRYTTNDKAFQKVNNKDVIFSILPDNDIREFENSHQGVVNGLVVVMNFKKLDNLEYDVKTCYELMIDVLGAVNKSYNGILMNEHRVRLTKKDKQSYLEAIT